MEPSTKAIRLSANTTYVNIACLVNNDLVFFNLDFIRNEHYWGVILRDPDGKSAMHLVGDEEEITTTGDVFMKCEEYELKINVTYDRESETYTVFINDN